MMPAPMLLSPPDSTAGVQRRGGAFFVHDGGAAAKPAPPTAPSRAMNRTAARDALYTRDRSGPWRRRRPRHGRPRSGDGSIAVAKGLLWAGARGRRSPAVIHTRGGIAACVGMLTVGLYPNPPQRCRAVCSLPSYRPALAPAEEKNMLDLMLWAWSLLQTFINQIPA
jgi:hypothetical protein